ncbi:C2 domain containing protein [Nitzschia inconspicua]|uniref:C2 domain containing protein n=1 Tax=Nitzschia inconspicua TaxID=303405 RepID=A0A9K3LMG9_9STRA|nr:C2 domain containing protein [Nitzschia inconspicua]
MIESCLPRLPTPEALKEQTHVSFDFINPTLSSELEEAMANPENMGRDSTTGSIQSSYSVNMESISTSEMDDARLLGDHDRITLLCELIGARGLKALDNDVDNLLGNTTTVDSNTLRPYCVVKFDDRRIHRTSAAQDAGCNPIWVPSTKSLFLLETSAHEMSRSHLNIAIFSRGKLTLPVSLLQTSSTFLGQVTMDSSTILAHCDQERFEVNIEDEIGEANRCFGKLALRFRVASPSDIQTVKFFNERGTPRVMDESQREFVDIVMDSATKRPAGKTQKHLFPKSASRQTAQIVTERDEAQIAQSGFVNAVSNVFARKTTRDRETGARKIRVKPGPDPSRKHETEFLKPHDLKIETRLPSKNWVEAGSGTLGKLFVEILSCHDLPNMDSGGQLGNLTDTFCCVVYEDSCAMTDVIDDELSPHWMPWTQRAFCFNMIHPASVLYLAAFDFDLGIGQHDAIGRVAVNICNLQRDTIHTLKYNLYPSSNITDRIAVGSITIRLRIECFDERAALLAGLKPRPNIHVNVTKEKSFRVVRYTCFGEYDNEEKFDLTVTRSYVNEIFEYKAAVTYAVGDALKSLVFWRGQVQIFTVMVPIHSLVFYVMATKLVERPQLIVPYTLLAVAWSMLANLSLRRHHPSPWERCPSFLQFVHILRTGQSSIPIKSVKEYEGAEAAEAYENAWKKRLEEDRMIAARKAELLQEINDIGDDNIHTQVSTAGPIPLDLLMRLARYQAIVGRLCKKFRLVKIILTWEESVISFWVTSSFLCAGLVALILPWGFILTWLGRIVVYGFLGPHMKLIDLYFRANEKENSALKELSSKFHIERNIARRRREEALKIKDMKEAAFGQYSVQVPSFNLSRHFDRPLPQSSSRVCRKTPKIGRQRSRRLSVVDTGNAPRIPGQQLYGVMIPRPQDDENVHNEEARVGERLLKQFHDRVHEIKDAEGLSEYEQKQLLKLGVHPNSIPMSFGYEVTPLLMENENPSTNQQGTIESRQDRSSFDGSVSSIDSGFKSRHHGAINRDVSVRVAVRLTSDKEQFVDNWESNNVVLESDGVTTYCISENAAEEEGLEVIGLGRFNTISETVEKFEEDLRESMSNESLEVDHRLSRAFSSNEHVQVAYYRPTEEEEDYAIDSDCTKQKTE